MLNKKLWYAGHVQSHMYGWLDGIKKRREKKRKEKEKKGRTSSSKEHGLGVTSHCMFLTIIPQ
jgi:hypothetical protein